MPEPDIIALALAEDIGTGDLTTRYFTGTERQATARILTREPCVLAGLDCAREIFHRIDPALQLHTLRNDGAALTPGDIVMEISGPAASILTAERTALNFLQRLSGIATLTREFVNAVRGTNAKILDTRKTTPGWRTLEKSAVRAGGGTNHRLGLHDMVMVKDNHLAAGTTLHELQAAILKVKTEHPDVRIELEADTLQQVKDFSALDGVDVILLDNMPPARLREAVALRRPELTFEASGGVTLSTVRAIAETGVDSISVGTLTHSARAIDFSLEIQTS